jgi:carbon monoxide dehydrogenase subunit G
MASILKELLIDASPDAVWEAIRDVGAVHQRLAPGFVTDVRLDGDARIVTFANGAVVRESIVSLDDGARRFAYSASGGRATHHNASMQVVDAGDGTTRLLWFTDLLPDDAADTIRGMVEQGSVAIKRTLERRR